jgi:hypothetical protein
VRAFACLDRRWRAQSRGAKRLRNKSDRESARVHLSGERESDRVHRDPWAVSPALIIDIDAVAVARKKTGSNDSKHMEIVMTGGITVATDKAFEDMVNRLRASPTWRHRCLPESPPSASSPTNGPAPGDGEPMTVVTTRSGCAGHQAAMRA